MTDATVRGTAHRRHFSLSYTSRAHDREKLFKHLLRQRIHVGIRARNRNSLRQEFCRRFARTKCAHFRQKECLLFAAAHTHRVDVSSDPLLYLTGARNDSETEQKRGHIIGEKFTASRKIDGRCAALMLWTNTDTSIGRPQVLQQQSNLGIAQLKHFRRQMFLVRALTVYPQTFEPSADARRVPTIAVS